MRRRSTILAVLLALAVVPYFIDLGGSAIWDANEAFYVETPRQMMVRGDYITPSFNDEPRINKPVLSYWIVAAFYHAFGVSVGVERLTIALGSHGDHCVRRGARPDSARTSSGPPDAAPPCSLRSASRRCRGC